MEWKPEVKELYDKIVEKMPEFIKPVIAPELLKKVEIKCIERNAQKIAEMDLIVGLFEVTPPTFQPTVIADLEEMGVSYDRYLAKVKSDFKCNTDLNQMIEDISKICDISSVTFNREAMWKSFNTFKDFFKGAPVSIRTTTKPIEKRDVAVRYVEFFMPHNPDPYTMAIKEGLLLKNGHPIHEMIIESMNTFEMMGYGVDVDAKMGLSKIWPFVVPGSIEPIFSMKSVPPAFKKYKQYFEEHGLTVFSLFAFDFLNHTMNIYFMLKQPAQSTHESCVKLVEDLGLTPASEEIMEGCRNAAHLNYTFSWESGKIERLCFGVTVDDEKDVPTHLHPLIKEFVEKAPLQSESRKFIWGATFTPRGVYYKIENDYNGTMVDFLGMGCKAGIEKYN
ncbi:MAG: hypothetical protein JW891_08865 [Candidatus Lokiarchaeota archaeon]|nr:hypothetical protein [Candidatus Lokiarchaeota archaeon]